MPIGWCGRSSKPSRPNAALRMSDLIIPGTRRIAPVLWVGMGLAAFQQFVGINIIFYFGEILWKAAGATEEWALRINVLTGLVNILATIPAIMLIDRIGRKPLLLVGSIGMTLTLGAMAAVFATADAGPDGKPVLSHMAAVAGLTAANLVHRRVCCVVGSGDVGVVRRDVSQRNSWSCSCHFRRHQLGGEFHRHRHFFTAAEGGRPHRRLRFLRDSRSDLAPLCVAYRV